MSIAPIAKREFIMGLVIGFVVGGPISTILFLCILILIGSNVPGHVGGKVWQWMAIAVVVPFSLIGWLAFRIARKGLRFPSGFTVGLDAGLLTGTMLYAWVFTNAGM